MNVKPTEVNRDYKKEGGNSNAFRIRIRYRSVCKLKYDNGNILGTVPSAGASLRSVGRANSDSYSLVNLNL